MTYRRPRREGSRTRSSEDKVSGLQALQIKGGKSYFVGAGKPDGSSES